VSTDAGKRGPYAPSRRRREQIAQAVLDIVDELGHERVTTALVAERSGTPEATVLYHFPTKDHLLIAALELVDQRLAEETGALSESPAFDIEAFRDSTSETEPRMRLQMAIRGQAGTRGHPAAEFYRHRLEQGIEIFTRVIRRRQQEGLAHPGIDPVDAARQFYALWDGLGEMALLGMEFDQTQALIDGFRRITGANWMEARDRMMGDDIGL